MKKLLGYEFRKAWSSKLILLGISMVLELAFLVGVAIKHDETIATSIVFLVFCTIGGLIYIGVESVIILHRDINTRQGYMLFMTPNSSYAILGAKVLENAISLLLCGCFYALLAGVDIMAVLSRYGQLDILAKQVQQVLSQLMPSLKLNWQIALSAFFEMICSYLFSITLAYFADVLASSLLRSRKGGGFIAFLVFVVLSTLASQGMNALTGLFFKSGNLNVFVPRMLMLSFLSLLLSFVMYLVTAHVMERKLSI